MLIGHTVPGDMKSGRRLLPWKQVGSNFRQMSDRRREE